MSKPTTKKRYPGSSMAELLRGQNYICIMLFPRFLHFGSIQKDHSLHVHDVVFVQDRTGRAALSHARARVALKHRGSCGGRLIEMIGNTRA